MATVKTHHVLRRDNKKNNVVPEAFQLALCGWKGLDWSGVPHISGLNIFSLKAHKVVKSSSPKNQIQKTNTVTIKLMRLLRKYTWTPLNSSYSRCIEHELLVIIIYFLTICNIRDIKLLYKWRHYSIYIKCIVWDEIN